MLLEVHPVLNPSAQTNNSKAAQIRYRLNSLEDPLVQQTLFFCATISVASEMEDLRLSRHHQDVCELKHVP